VIVVPGFTSECVPKARTYYEKVVAIASDADKSRSDVNEARAFLAKKS